MASVIYLACTHNITGPCWLCHCSTVHIVAQDNLLTINSIGSSRASVIKNDRRGVKDWGGGGPWGRGGGLRVRKGGRTIG